MIEVMPDVHASRHHERRRQSAKSSALALLLLALVGCASLPESSDTPLAIGDLAPLEAGLKIGRVDAWPAEAWWRAFGDPQLNELVDTALASSPTLQMAMAQLRQAEAAAATVRGASLPQVNAEFSASRGRQSANYLMPPPPLSHGGQFVNQGSAMIGLGFDLDLWGRQAALIRAASGEIEAARFDRETARLALATSIVRTYSLLAGQCEQLEIAQYRLTQQQKVATLVRQRRSAGLDTALEVRQAEGAEASLEAELSQLNLAIRVSKLQLALLIGAQPEAANGIHAPALKMASVPLPENLTLDLLGRHPEIAAQRARVDAAEGRVLAARAAFYPNINLSALIGYQAIGIEKILTAASAANSIGPAISLPLFDGGRLQAGHAQQVASRDAAIARYNESVLSAAQDVAEQLARLKALDAEGDATRRAVEAAEAAYRLVDLRYREGIAAYLQVLSAESQRLAARRAFIDLESRRRDSQINLIRALGGGFSLLTKSVSSKS